MLSRRLADLLVVVAVVTSACGSNGDTTADTERDQAPDTDDASGPTSYPLTITNRGEEYTFEEPPSRVVVMNGGSYAEVSSLLALGVGDRVVANAQELLLSDRPELAEQAAELPTGDVDLGEMGDIPREAMLGLRPDFVLSTWGGGFSAENGFATRDELRQAGANTYVPEAYCAGDGSIDDDQTVEDSYELLRDLGRIFDVGDRAEELIADAEQRIAAVEQAVAGREPKRVLFMIPGMDMGGEFSSVGAGGGVWTDIIERAGGDNVFAEDGGGEVFANPGREQMAAADVEGLVTKTWQHDEWAGARATANDLLDRFPEWPASEEQRYVVLAESIYLGPSNALAVEEIARMLHPEAF
jgi:iron complex transport system substrate-binding protein